MRFLQRYLDGEYERVWDELQALGAGVRADSVLADARAVAAETMRRVGRNCRAIVDHLRAAGSEFGVYPDGSPGYHGDGPLVPSSGETRRDAEELEARVGPMPLSLAAFWAEVGSVDLVGRHPGAPDLLDPLVVGFPAAALEELDDWESDADADDGGGSGRFQAGLAPDFLHKDDISGGEAYAVALPDPSADFVLLNERHAMRFVPYLRMAILRWGGFPGLEGREERYAVDADLLARLERF